MARAARLATKLLVIAMLAGGCSSASKNASTGDAAMRGELSFSYRGLAPAGTIDQVLTIHNAGSDVLAPTLAFVAIDAAGRAIPGVEISTAYGSDHGLVVVPPGGAIDVLAFHKVSTPRIADVHVRIISIAKVAMPPVAALVTVQAIDRNGQPVTSLDQFASVILTNPNPSRVTVRVVALSYDNPVAGVPQQVTSALAVAGPVTVPANGGVTVRLPPAIAARTGHAGSIKAYFSHG